jgi:hypothetical protein
MSKYLMPWANAAAFHVISGVKGKKENFTFFIQVHPSISLAIFGII